MRRLLVVLVAGLAACTAEPGGERREQPHGIVLLVLDTARADHFSAYGYERDTTPSLERLAARGTLFESLQAPSPWTVPTMASLWTGLYPSQHGAGVVSKQGEPRLFEGVHSLIGFHRGAETLTERLRAAGFRTFARVANALLELDCFEDGFDEIETRGGRADAVVAWGLERMEAFRSERFFLYLHFMDAHAPLRPPPKHLARYLDDPPGDGEVESFRRRVATWDGYTRPERLRSPGLEAFAADRTAVYDGTLHFLDAQIGRLVQAFDDAGLADEVLFVVTSDHGEELWDHWELQLDAYDVDAKPKVGVAHGHTLFQELLRVPLILAGPGVPAGRVVSTPQRQLDLGATVLDLAGLPPPLGDARSLVPLLEGGSVGPADLYSEGLAYGHELRSLLGPDGFKLIRATSERERDLLFYLPDDPGETRDLAQAHPDVVERLGARLDAIARSLEDSRLPPGETATDVELEALKALGYVED